MANPEDTKPEEAPNQSLKEVVSQSTENMNVIEPKIKMSFPEGIASQEIVPPQETVPLNAQNFPDSTKRGDVSGKESVSGLVQSEGLSKEPVASLQLKAELSFVLGQQMIPMEELKSLVEGKIISLGVSQFEASVMLQEKIIAQADLILVEGAPSLQITKIVTV